MELTIEGSSVIWKKAPNSCYTIDGKMLLDCGEGVTKTIGDTSFDTIDNLMATVKDIIITHYHSDHYFGLSTFLSHYMYYAKPEEHKTLTIYGPKGLKQVLNNLYNLSEGFIEQPTNDVGIDKVINLVEIDFEKSQNPTFNLNGYKVTCFNLDHGSIRDIGYIFDDGKVKVGFSGDCTYDETLEKFVQQSDVCFLDCAGPKTGRSHLGLDKFVEFRDKYPNKKFIPVHCSEGVWKIAHEYGVSPSNPGDKYSFGNSAPTSESTGPSSN